MTAKKSAKKRAAVKKPAKKAPARKPASKKSPRAMPKLRKSSTGLLKAFAQTMAALPMAETKTVFGSPAAFANGHMFAGVQNESFFLRLPDAERELFLQTVDDVRWEPMPGRPMREYVVLPAPLIESPGELSDWLGKSIAYVQSLPPKAAKKK